MAICIVTVNGQAMSAPFYSRLVSLECVDSEGIKSDTCRIELNDGPWSGGFLRIPERGEIITVALGETIAALIGVYELDEVEVQCFPFSMVLSGKSIDVRKKMKANKERHWDDVTVFGIVSEIASEHGLSANVSGSVGSHFYDWIGQMDESDLHFLERLAQRHNALFAVKNGQLIFAERGSGLSAAGVAISAVSVTPEQIVEGTCQVRFADRSIYKDVVAYYQDKNGVQRKELKVEADPQGEATYRLGEPYASESEATKAAGSKARQLQRAADRLNVTVLGDPGIAAGAPVTLTGVRPGVDGRAWIIKSARHRFEKGGFTTSIEAETQA